MATHTTEPWPGLELYHRLGELGAFDHHRVELLDGIITPKEVMKREHAQAVVYLTRWVISQLDEPWEVRVQLPLSLGDRSEPEPDVAIVSQAIQTPYHPGGAEWICEVADASLGRDRLVKRDIYSRFGIAEYLIVAIPERIVEVHTTPTAGGYADRQEVSAGVIVSESVPGLEIDVAALWAATFKR